MLLPKLKIRWTKPLLYCVYFLDFIFKCLRPSPLWHHLESETWNMIAFFLSVLVSALHCYVGKEDKWAVFNLIIIIIIIFNGFIFKWSWCLCVNAVCKGRVKRGIEARLIHTVLRVQCILIASHQHCVDVSHFLTRHPLPPALVTHWSCFDPQVLLDNMCIPCWAYCSQTSLTLIIPYMILAFFSWIHI